MRGKLEINAIHAVLVTRHGRVSRVGGLRRGVNGAVGVHKYKMRTISLARSGQLQDILTYRHKRKTYDATPSR